MSLHEISELNEATAYDSAGEKLGAVEEVFVCDATGQPKFVEVSHGLFGVKSGVVPLLGHRLEDGDLHVAFPKERINGAPEFDGAHISPEQEERLYRHYGIEDAETSETYS
ncbi:PRC-barrel domain protein [Corynebacterium ciconiae DSM 44920]|uniref:PRC-barrel domain-containing protein n=1 Tax=Corynebacterium ciconiae TaxID=227319 RepID=UPI0003609BE3|nr:PRC-barrel domain-containing protein [Corynebacterium ciconiae]WKD60075.1 PRC-barrel domain protein [Corynebacterium ciconiae DSM 44920]